MNMITFTSTQKRRGCEEYGPSTTTWVETVCESGEVRWAVFGRNEDGAFCESGVRTSKGAVDLAVVKEARERGGWRVIETQEAPKGRWT